MRSQGIQAALHLLRAVSRGLRHLAVGLLALVILFEEWGWDPLQRALRWLSRIPVMRQIEAATAQLSPGAALTVLLLPTLGLLPVKGARILGLAYRAGGQVRSSGPCGAGCGDSAPAARPTGPQQHDQAPR